MIDTIRFINALNRTQKTVKDLADMTGNSELTMYQKIHGAEEMTTKDIQVCADVLCLTNADIEAIFFPEYSRKRA